MKTPSHSEWPPTSIRRSKRLLLRAKPLPEISGAVATYEATVNSYEGLYDQWVQARRELIIARGDQSQAEEAVDRQIRGVGLAILTLSGGRRKSEVLRRYFPNGYGATLGLSAEESLPIAEGLLEAMDNETSTGITFLREPLTEARDRLVTIAAATQAAANALGRAKANLEEGKLAWWKAHNDFYFAARSTYSDRRGFVESLFKVNGRGKTVEEEVPGEGGDAGDSTGSGGLAAGGPVPVPAPTIALVPPQAAAPVRESLVADGAASDVAA
jgi:hypothetical protein